MRFRLWGVEIYISFLFVALPAALLLCDRTGLLLPSFAAAAWHELGHLAAMRLFGCPPKRIRFVPGAVQITRPFCCRKGAAAGIALAGPAANIAAAAGAFLLYKISHSGWALQAVLLHTVIGGFNLLPVRGLDGGTVLRELLLHSLSAHRTDCILTGITILFAAALFPAGVWLLKRSNNYSPAAVAVYLLFTALLRR